VLVDSSDTALCRYDLFKNMLRRPEQVHLSAWQHSAAAGMAGVAGLAVTNPFWVVKTRMALQMRGNPDARYRSVPQALVSIVRTEGLRGLYRGFAPGIIGSTHGIVQFVAYEEMKRAMAARRDKSGRPPQLVRPPPQALLIRAWPHDTGMARARPRCL
jgi:solute carrier family 25 folate transporter 32